MAPYQCLPRLFSLKHLRCMSVMMMLLVCLQTAAFGREPVVNREMDSQRYQRKAVHLYFSDGEMRLLAAEKRELYCATDDVSLGRCILSALIEGPQKGLVEVLPKETQLKAFFITDDGTAYVDFNDAVSLGHPGGARCELLTVFAVVNSLTLNLTQINRVQILIDGRQRETLAGHIAISDPFKANILLIK